MKCQHCGKNDATFYYRRTVNGHTTQAHLCHECAGKLEAVSAHKLHSLGAFNDDFFARPFAAMDAFFGSAASRLLTEFPAPGNTLADAAQEKQEDTLLSPDEQRAFAAQCRRNALEQQLKNAVAAENYEEAARLRDELRTLGNG